MLDNSTLPVLRKGKNLLAFSGGVDSTALFFLLLDENIPFDIAHVNYHTRAQSMEEAAYAQSLAQQHGKQCFYLDAPEIEGNFEAEARRVRYDFFESLIDAHGYDTLLTAHQLDDRLEWLLMQLCKGAGLPELLGMEPVSERDDYTLVRPLLGVTKSELRSRLNRDQRTYSIDASNEDPRYLRNRFRHRYAAPLLEAYRQGIGKSFEYLSKDAEAISAQGKVGLEEGFMMIKTPQNRLELMRTVDRWLKRNDYLLRQGEKERIQREDELILGRKFALSITPLCTLLTPLETAVMPKTFRERCRVLGIGPKVRPFLYANPAIFEAVAVRLLSQRPEA
ncbi:MAG: tRNA lysidine(34) synthetase TilS [Campylobacterales bacterium]